MSLSKALETLMKLGLSRMDAQVYVYIAKKGPCTKKDLALALKTTNKLLGQSLRNLQTKGYVTSKMEKQTFFTAIQLGKIIEDHVKAETEQLQRIKQAKEDYLSNKSSRIDS